MGAGLLSRAAGCVAVSGVYSPAAAQEPPGEWTLTVGARESNEFSRIENGVKDDQDLILDNVNLGISYSTRTERSQYSLFGRAGANAYRERDDRNQFNYGGGLSWSYTPSARLNSTLSFGADRGFQAETLSNLGVLAPGMDTTSANTFWGLQYMTGPRTRLSTQISYDYVRFESDQPIPGSQIVVGRPPFRDEFGPLFPDLRDDDRLPVPNAEGDVLDILATEGFLLGPNESHSAFAIVGIGHQWSEYSSLGFDVGAGYRRVDHQDPGLLQEGAAGAFRVWAQRRLGRSSTMGTSYELDRSLILDPATTIQTLSGGYAYFPQGKSVSLRLSGGASYYTAENGVSSLTPIADVLFGAGLTRSTRFDASYRRQFAQSLGFGSTLLIDYANVSLSQEFGSKVDLTISGGASFGSDPLIEGSRYDAVQAGATLSYDIVRSFQIGASYFWLKTEQADPGVPLETERNLASVFVTYTKHWR